MKDIFDILMEKGNPKLAIRYAKRIIKDGQGKTPAELAPFYQNVKKNESQM